ncbi:MAG: DUF1801 domain-containing protein [Bacteroidetes bacterium]|nr:DUF1801 domain-containing protein [Bacteroidota bacterium]
MSKKSKPPKYKTVKEYFDIQSKETLKTLLALKKLILKVVPDAVELINYDIPAYALVKDGKRDKQIMIAGYKKFAGFYVGTGILDKFSTELKEYEVGKASVQFPNNQPLPEKLITSIIKFKIETIKD